MQTAPYAPPPSFPCLSCFSFPFFFLLPPPQIQPPPLCITLYCVYAPPSFTTFNTFFLFLFNNVKVQLKKKCSFGPPSLTFLTPRPWFLYFHPQNWKTCRNFLPVSPLWASLYPPPLPPLTSPPLSLFSSASLSSCTHSVVGVRVDWPESASWTPSTLFDPLLSSAFSALFFKTLSHLFSSPIHLCPALGGK